MTQLPGIPLPAPRRKLRLTPPEPSEREIHEACAQALNRLLLPPAMWRCYPAGHVQLSAAEVTRLARIGLKRGWPDIDLVHAGRVYGIELKRRGARLSKTRIGRTMRGSPRVYLGQADVFPQLEKAGMKIAVVHSVDEMLAQLHAWGLPLLSRSPPTGASP